MTEEQMNDGLESLFRRKLEENEMVAGSDLKDRVMGRLERREFFRFNLSRFNIYYLTAALTVLTVAGLMLLPGTADTEDTVSPLHGQQSVKVPQPDKPEQQVDQPLISDTVKTDDSLALETAGKDEAAGQGKTSAATPARATDREQSINKCRHVAETILVSPVGKPPATAGISMTESLPERALSLETSVTSGCVPLQISFMCNAEENSMISWNFGDGGTSSLKNPDYVFDIPGTYTVILTVTGSSGQAFLANTVIDVWERPKAAFEVRKVDSWDEGDRVEFINLSSGALEYLWDFGDGVFSTLSDPVYRYRQMGTYDVMLTVWSAEGCADSVTVNDLFTDKGMYIRFPNAFVPGSGGPTGGYYNSRTDEESTVFHPVASGVDEYNLKVYSKAGLPVFESNETGIGWDGYYRGELCPPGVYVWKVRGTYRNGRTFIMAGDVTLLKY